MAGGQTLREQSFRPEIFLAAMAAIVLEISLTRVFSFKLYYYFTYLILGIALLGLGAGGVFVASFERLRRAAAERVVAACCLAAGAAVPLAYTIAARVQVNTIEIADGPAEVLKLALICVSLFVPFLLVGIALSTIFGARPRAISGLYFADLVGAGIGCALCVPLFQTIAPPGAVLLAGLLLAVAGARLAWAVWRPAALAGALLALALAVPLAVPELVPEPVPDKIKAMSPQQNGDREPLHSSWSSVFRVDLVEGMAPEQMYLLVHDGMLGAMMPRFDGDWSKLGAFDSDLRALPFRVLEPKPRVLIIGSAGGHEILASLHFDAAAVTGVELNPVTVSLVREHFADYVGRIADDPRVTIVNGEGRSFVARQDERWDLIWFVAPDSYSALNAASSGAFVLSESYLYTVEMLVEAMQRLEEGGVVCAQFGEVWFDKKPNRTTRYLATAREALRRLGIRDFERHVLLSTAKGIFTDATILLKRTPFSDAEVERFRAAHEHIEGGTVLHAGASGGRPPPRPVNQVISLPDAELAGFLDAYPYVVTPVTDDSPFFWHFVRFRDAVLRPGGERDLVWNPEDATGERMLATLLGIVSVLAALFLLLPLLLLRATWQRIPYKANALVYFAALGLGFMFFEVSLIQKLTLFLGYPTYSLTVTIFALLIFSGIGSLVSPRYSGRRNRALARLLAALVVLMLFYQFGVGWAVQALAASPLAVRVAVTIAMLAPLGLCLGAFMPIGLATLASITEHEREYVAWGWAVNGFFSVVSSVLATMLSMSFGFRAVLLLAACVYAVGVAALSRIPERAPVSG